MKTLNGKCGEKSETSAAKPFKEDPHTYEYAAVGFICELDGGSFCNVMLNCYSLTGHEHVAMCVCKMKHNLFRKTKRFWSKVIFPCMFFRKSSSGTRTHTHARTHEMECALRALIRPMNIITRDLLPTLQISATFSMCE